MAKLLVPAGGLTHDNCGETFSPMQFSFCGKFARLLATFFGIISPSRKVVDDRANSFGCCASAVPPAHRTAMPPARIRRPIDCCKGISPFGFLPLRGV